MASWGATPLLHCGPDTVAYPRASSGAPSAAPTAPEQQLIAATTSCHTNTTGTCQLWWPCDASRNAVCDTASGKCMCRSGQCVVNDTCVSPTTVSSTSTLILLREQLRSQEQQIANYSLQNRELEQKVFDGRLREAQLEQNLSLAREQKPAPEPPSQTPAQEVSAAPSNAGVLDVNSSARAKCSQFSRGPNREFVAWSEAGQLDCNPAKLTAQQKQAATECAEATRCYPGGIRIGTYETRISPGSRRIVSFSFPISLAISFTCTWMGSQSRMRSSLR